MRIRLIITLLAVVMAGCTSTATSTTITTVATTTTTTSPAPGSTTTTPPTAMFPVSVPAANGLVVIEQEPERIAALSATHVEMLFAIGAGDQVFAVDMFSNYPEEANTLEKIDSFNLNAEAVIALAPDLVVLTFDPGDIVDSLTAVGIPTLLFDTPATLDDVENQLLTVGVASGQRENAEAVWKAMDARIQDLITQAGGAGMGVTYYHETDSFSYYTPNSSSFIGQLYGMLGMSNVADEAPDEFGSGFPQLSPEFIVASDPDIIYLATAGLGETPETIAARPGWDTMTAIQEGRVVLVDTDIASRWGPRIVDLMELIVSGLVG